MRQLPRGSGSRGSILLAVLEAGGTEGSGVTALDLAEKLATAAIRASQPQGMAPYGDAPAQAVLRCLVEHSSWLCRLTLTEDAEGMHADTLEEPYELEQMDLFR